MSLEVIDIFIVTVIVLFALLFVLQKLKHIVYDDSATGCSSCGGSNSCQSEAKAKCDGSINVEIFK